MPISLPPTRHLSAVSFNRKTASRLRLFLRDYEPPLPAQWHALGMRLWQGDPLADDVVDWMHEVGMSVARPMFERAIEHGLSAELDAPPALRRFFDAVSTPPAWLDTKLLDQGAAFTQSTGVHGMMVLRDAGLMAGYQAGAINQTLVMTGALKRGPQRRIAETTCWWIDCTRTGGMHRWGAGFRNTLRVRVMHALVRKDVARRAGWNAAHLGLPVNQVDMQATYLGFSVAYLLALRGTGVPVTAADAHAVMHLWRYIAWVMGVDPELLYETEAQARIGLYNNLISQGPADESSVVLGRALMDEPLSRHYPTGAWWRGPWNKARHLSLTRWFVGRQGMKNLGLPMTLPWYPLLSSLPRAAWHVGHRLLPGGALRLQAQGGQAQAAYLSVLFGADSPTLARAHGTPTGPGHERKSGT
jgi:ER-bound oxygenase mpaB/B'/Rubber oxygenase, catalytic domain